MGRASRRKHRDHPLAPLENEGDKACLLEAGYLALERLQSDLRMIEQFLAWQRGRDLPRLFEHSFTIAPTPWSALRPLSDAAAQEARAIIWRPPSAVEQATLEETLEAMGVSTVWPFGVWAAHQFVHRLIPTFVHNMCLPDQPVVLRVDYLGPPLQTRGYIPGDKGSAKLRRDSGWWYRRTIKNPPDDLSALAREYLASVNRYDSSRSRVEEGIKDFESLLRRVCQPADGAVPNKTGHSPLEKSGSP